MKYDTARLRSKSLEFRIKNVAFSIRKSLAKSEGFTLIELLVVISIIGMLLGFSIAAYSTFNRTQTYNNTVNDVVNMLQVARSRAVSQYAPAVYCSTTPNLQNYKVVITATDITMQIVCGSGPTTSPIQTANISDSVQVDTAVITFTVGTGALTPPTPVNINIKQGSKQRTVTVDANGRVSLD